MGKTYILAADIGGSGTKSMLYDTDGKILHLAFRESKYYHDEGPDAMTCDPEEVFASAFEGMKECIEVTQVNPKEVVGICVDGQQSGLLWVDKEFNPVGVYDHWMDNRYAPYVKVMTDICEERILELGGTATGFVHGPKILWWKDHKPDQFKEAYKFVIPGTFVGGRLAGLKGDDAYFEHTSYGFSGFADQNKDCWDKEICDACGIPYEKLPKITKPTDIVGGLCKKYADILGLPEGVPIVSGAGDFPAGTVACGVTENGTIGDIAGTASIFYSCMNRWKPDPEGTIRTLRSPIPGMWLPFNLFNGGGIMRWYRDAFYSHEKEEVDDVYEYLEEKVKGIAPGTDGLAFYPYIGGKHSDPTYNGAWVGIKFGHEREHFFRSIMESVTYEYRFYMDAMKKLLDIDEFNETRVIGGGAADDTWNQMKADVLRVKYKTTEQLECTLMGTAMIAAYAVGAIDDLVHAHEKVNPVVKEFTPNEETSKVYDEYFEKWMKLGHEHGEFLYGLK